MNTVTAVLSSSLMRQVGWMLLYSLWQGALIGLVFVGLRYALRRRSARARYVVGCLCLAGLLAAPVLTMALGGVPAGGGASDRSDWSDRPYVVAPPFSMGGGAEAFSGGGMAWPAIGGADFFTLLAPWLAVAWVLGVMVFSARLTRCYRWVRHLRTRDYDDVDPAWLLTLNDLRQRLGVSRPVRLLQSALVEVPTVVGWLRPVILLPASTLSGLTPGQLEAILAHELAHVRRLDYLVNAFQCLVETLMFYHPVAWWISRCIREERENCCDDMAVEVCGDRVGYARALATLEGLRAELPGWAFAASGGSLLGRVRRLLGRGDERGATTIREVSGLALLGVGLILILLGIRMLLAVPTYQSTARIRVERDQSDLSGLGDQRGRAAYDPYFIQTEFEVIQSEVVLGKVIEDLDLNHQWGKQYAGGERLKTPETLDLLRARLDLRTVRNTSLIEIRVRDEKPDEAAKIANAVAEAYRAHRLLRRMEMSKGGIQALNERFQDQEARIRDAEKKVEEIRQKLGAQNLLVSIDGPAATGENAPASVITADSLRKLETLRIETQAQYVRESSLLEQLDKLEKNQGHPALAQIIPTVMQDAVLSATLQDLGAAEAKLSSLAKEYGDHHLEVIKVQSQIADLQKQLQQRVDGMMTGLRTKVLSLSNSLQNLNTEVREVGRRDVERANAARPYYEARRNVEELQRFRDVLGTKIANEQTELALPKTAMVEIVDRAIPARRASSRGGGQGVVLLAAGLLMDLVGLFLLIRRPGGASNWQPG